MSFHSKDQVALRFYESCLRLSDVHLLKGPYWLNDQIISFYFAYLEKLIFKDEVDVLFVSPEVTQCIRMVSEEEVGTFLEPLKATQRMFIFFALNDNQIADRAGGSHWSLLVFSRPEMVFYHFDSVHNSNWEICQSFVVVLKRALNCPNAQLRIGACLQQSNGYDCGVHVLCTVDKVMQQIRKTRKIEGVKSASYYVIRGKRMEILNIIIDLGGRIN